MKFLLFLSGVLISCASGPGAKPPQAAASLSEKSPLLQAYMQSHQLNHLVSGCKVFDKDMNNILKYPGQLCIFEPDGSTVIANKGKLEKYDRQFKLLWSLNLYANHQLKLSKSGSEYLLIASRYHPVKKDFFRRFDELMIIAKSGKILKRFSFHKKSIFTPFQYNSATAVITWTSDGFAGKSAEATHVNAFSEIYSGAGPEKKLSGYVAVNPTPGFAAFFDTSLKPVKVISLGEAKVHDIQQKDANSFLFYGNYLKADDPKSFVGILHADSGRVGIFYQNPAENLLGTACGSVQQLDEDKYFIFHSNCDTYGTDKPEYPAHWEFVDMAAGRQETVELPLEFKKSTLRLEDLRSYFQNSIGK